MFCTNCGAKNDDSARFCTECGAPLQPVAPPVQSVEPAATSNYAPTQGSPVSGPSAYGTAWNPAAPTPPKKKGGKAALWIILAVVLVAGVLAALNFNAITAFVRSNLSSPLSYYQYTETRGLEKMAKTVSTVYENSVLKTVERGDFGADGTLTIRLGDAGKTLAESAMDTDLSWLDSVALQTGTTRKGEDLGLDAKLLLNGKKLLSLAVLMESEGQVYAQVPELAEDWASLELPDFGEDSILSTQNLTKAIGMLQQVMPDRATMESMLVKYGGIAISGVKNVERSKGTLGVFDVQTSGTMLSIRVTEAELREIVKSICKELSQDTEIRNILERAERAMGERGLYDDFIDGVERAMEDADDLRLDSDLRMTLWLDKAGNIIGRQVDVDNDGFRFELPRSGEQFALLMTAYQDGDTMLSLSGSGSLGGTALTGSFALSNGEDDILLLELERLDVAAALLGKTDARISLRPTRALAELMYLNSAASAMVSAMRIELSLSGDAQRSNAELKVLSGEKSLFSLEMDSNTGDTKALPAPEGALPMEEWMEENGEELFGNLLSILMDSDIPMSQLQGLFN